MNLDDVAAQLLAALATIEGLRLPPWGVESIEPPAAVVTLPDRVEYDYVGYGRGADRYPDVAVVVMVGNADARSARSAIAPYAAGDGPQSVKAAIEAYTYDSCDSVRVAWGEFDTPTYAGTEYLAFICHLDIVGKAIAP